MEHQTMNGYGNGFKLDPNGFDWLIQHEFAHEWFGNLLTQESMRDFWLHEGFGFYMQPVYAQHVLGDMGYATYMWTRYNQIGNCKPVVPEGEVYGDYFVDNDPYFKGAWVMHTLRRMIGDKKFWRIVRKVLYGTLDPWSLSYPIKPQRLSTEDFIAIASDEYGSDLNWFFDVYMKQTTLPVLQTERVDDGIKLVWQNTNGNDFPMPVPLSVNGKIRLVDMAGGEIFLSLNTNDSYQIDPEMSVLRNFGTSKACQN
jgi:aminopeptidase N